MKYTIQALRKANQIIDERRSKAFETFQVNKNYVYDKIPEMIEIDNELSSSGFMISSAVLGKNAKSSIEDIRKKNNLLIQKKQELLKINGFSEDFLSIPYQCKKCNDSGYVDAMPCECLKKILEDIVKQEAIEKSAENSVSFDSFDLNYYPEAINGIPCKQIMTQTLESCKGYANNFATSSPNLLIFGGTGIGKTHISLAISKVVGEKGYNVIYLSAPDLFTSLEKERFSQEKPEYSIDNITTCDLLIIDDLGAEFTTSFTISALYNIINTRLLSDLPTIITANLIPSELTTRYSERIASRILGCFEHLRFVGNDIRILKKKA